MNPLPEIETIFVSNSIDCKKATEDLLKDYQRISVNQQISLKEEPDEYPDVQLCFNASIEPVGEIRLYSGGFAIYESSDNKQRQCYIGNFEEFAELTDTFLNDSSIYNYESQVSDDWKLL